MRTPVAIGVTLCDTVIVEAMTHKVSLIGCFTELPVPELPGPAEPFSVAAFLTGAQGTMDLELLIEESDSGDVIELREQRVYSPGPLSVVYCNLRLRNCPFPRPGVYAFVLRANGELVALRRARVVRRGGLV